MSEAISNIWRRPLQTALAIPAIVIGVSALTVIAGEPAANGNGGRR